MRVIHDTLPVGRRTKTSAQPVQARTQTGCCTTDPDEGLMLTEDWDKEFPRSEVLLPVCAPSPKALPKASGLDPRRESASSDAVELLEICRCG